LDIWFTHTQCTHTHTHNTQRYRYSCTAAVHIRVFYILWFNQPRMKNIFLKIDKLYTQNYIWAEHVQTFLTSFPKQYNMATSYIVRYYK
jgi:hypothetical protein